MGQLECTLAWTQSASCNQAVAPQWCMLDCSQVSGRRPQDFPEVILKLFQVPVSQGSALYAAMDTV